MPLARSPTPHRDHPISPPPRSTVAFATDAPTDPAHRGPHSGLSEPANPGVVVPVFWSCSCYKVAQPFHSVQSRSTWFPASARYIARPGLAGPNWNPAHKSPDRGVPALASPKVGNLEHPKNIRSDGFTEPPCPPAAAASSLPRAAFQNRSFSATSQKRHGYWYSRSRAENVRKKPRRIVQSPDEPLPYCGIVLRRRCGDRDQDHEEAADRRSEAELVYPAFLLHDEVVYDCRESGNAGDHGQLEDDDGNEPQYL